MTKDDFLLEIEPTTEPGPIGASTQTTNQDDFWADAPAPTPEASPPKEPSTAPEEPSTVAEARMSPDPSPESTSASDAQILADLAVLDRPDPQPKKPKASVHVHAGAPNDLSEYEFIFRKVIPVEVIEHPKLGRCIVVGTGGGVDSFVQEVWVEKSASAVPAYRDGSKRRIILINHNVGIRIRTVRGSRTAYLKVAEQGLRVVTGDQYRAK